MENITMSLVDEFLNVTDENKEVWRIKNDLSADFAIDKIREIKSEYNRAETVVKDKIQQLEHFLEKEKGKSDSERMFFESKLIEYFESIPEEHKKKTKTLIKYQLPTGTLQKKFKSPTYIKNDEELLKYAETNAPDYIETKRSLKWGEFKKQTKVVNGQVVDANTGEVLPIRLEEQAPVFEVKL